MLISIHHHLNIFITYFWDKRYLISHRLYYYCNYCIAYHDDAAAAAADDDDDVDDDDDGNVD